MASPIRPEIRARMGPANTALSFPTQVTSNPKRRYAVLFNEGSGYLLIDDLDSGANGETQLVSSLEDHQTCVRKLHHPLKVDPNVLAECPDIRYVPNQSHVPTVVSLHNYNQPMGQQISITYASIWQLCNGGTLRSFSDAWDDGSGATNRVPEAIAWHFLTTLCETFLDMYKQGIVHRDVHGGNFVLHWPQNTPLPELFLIDFGNGARYPQVSDLGFRDPWTGSFDETGQPSSNLLSPGETVDIVSWYTAAFHDLQTAIEIISWINVQQSNGSIGHSPMLLRTFTAWNAFLSDAWKQPSQALTGLNTLLSETRAQSDAIVQQFLARPGHAYRSVRWMRNIEARTQPAIWKDPARLFTRSQTLPDEFVIQGGGMVGSVILCEGQFRIVEVVFDQNTLQWSLTRVIDSINEVPSLSPDDDTQFDWRRFDQNARRNQHDMDSNDDDDADDEEDDDEDGRPGAMTTHIQTPFIQLLAPPGPSVTTPAPQSSSQDNNPQESEDFDNDPISRRRRAFLAQMDQHQQTSQGNPNAGRLNLHEDGSINIDNNIISQRQRDLQAQLATGLPHSQLRLAVPSLRLASSSNIDADDVNNPTAQRQRNVQARPQAPRPDPRLRSRSPRAHSAGLGPRTQQRRDYQAQRQADRPPSHEDDSDGSSDSDCEPRVRRRRVHRTRRSPRQGGHSGSTNTRQHKDNSDSEGFNNNPIAHRQGVHEERREARQRRRARRNR